MPRCPGYHWAPVDECTAAFMAVVECEAWEVLDTAEVTPAREEHARLYGGPKNWEVPFGKHRGKPLGEVPDGYLKWAVREVAANRGFRKFQERCRAELARRRKNEAK